MKRTLLVELPLTDYGISLEIQNSIVERKIRHGGDDVLLLLEHPPTVTLGTRGNDTDLVATDGCLASLGVSVYAVNRGGGATYHGPGQIVCYPIVDLRRLGLRVRDYVHGLEETVIRTLRLFGVTGLRQRKMPGVWIDTSHKIASVGVRIRRSVTSHGLSLNVNLTVDPTELIVVCGMPEVRMANLTELAAPPVDITRVRDALARSFGEVFGLSLERASLQEVSERGMADLTTNKPVERRSRRRSRSSA